MSLPCINATNGMRVGVDGSITLCCMSRDRLTDKHGQVVNASVHKNPIEKVVNGQKYIEIQDALNKGIRHENCVQCWAEEDAGIVSKRIRDNNEVQYTNDNNIKIVELNLGSLCNLKCRICGPWSSSRWFKDYKVIMPTDHIDYKKTILLRNDTFLDEIKNALPTIEKIDMYGGEPFLIKQQWELLQYSIDRGYSKNQILQFNTNGTYFDATKKNILNKFKNVYVSISVDGIENQFEYQRNPAKWESVLHNINLFKQLSTECDLVVHVCLTLNMYNMYYLDRYFKYFDDINVLSQINFLHSPSRWNVTNIPKPIKQIITEKYKEVNISEECNEWIKSAVNFMNSKDDNMSSWTEFLKITEKLDEIRSEKFKDVFPEFYEVITNESK